MKAEQPLPDWAEDAFASFDDDKDEHRTQANGGDGEQILPPPGQPMAVARVLVDTKFTVDNCLTLRHWRGSWWNWRTSHWAELEDRAVHSLLYCFVEHANYVVEKTLKPWAPTRKKIGDLADALAAICMLPQDLDQPNWLDGRFSGGIIVSVRNGLLDLERRQLLPHTPQYFNLTSVPFDYDPSAPQPERWLAFLNQLWPHDPQAIAVLGEWFGYVISGKLDLHKILLMVGPTRGGKGVIARVLTALIGRQHVAGPTLNSLGGEFGLAPLLGKPLAIISDARFVGKNGANIVVERLLSISGEDTLTVNRKYKDQWTGKLPSRLHVISNELPRLGDASEAITGRIVLLLLTNSWLGKEDHGLEAVLFGELTGILNWALLGLQRLTVYNGNRFTRLSSSDEAIIAMRDLASPVGAFVREKCVIGPGHEVTVDDLYATYKSWVEDNGHIKDSKQTFGRNLRAAVPAITVKRPRDQADQRVRTYVGIDKGVPGDA
jgi:putative DNA primase/helicase